MNETHKRILNHFNTTIPDNNLSEWYVDFMQIKTDNEKIRTLFSNYRETHDKGFRLTKFGLEIIKLFFKGYTIKRPKEPIIPKYLLYLDRQSNMPYFIGNDDFTLFDDKLAVQLKLADGNLSILIEMNGGFN